MRKYLSIIICTICLGFSSVSARANVTNQLDEITAQLENLDYVLQWFVDNQVYLEYWISGESFFDNFLPTFDEIHDINVYVQAAYMDLKNGIMPDIEAIRADVATLSANVASFVSQIVGSINGVSAEIEDIHQWLIHIGLDRIQYLLTQAQLDDSLQTFLSQLMSEFQNNYSVFSQILQSIQSLDTTSALQDSLNSIANALTQFGNVSIYLDLVEELENLDLNLNLDISSSLSGIENYLSSILNTLYNFSSAFNHFLQNFQTFQTDQLEMQAQLSDFITWYKGFFFNGLNAWRIRHYEWMLRQDQIAQSEAEYRDIQEEFLTGDATFPTDSDVSYLVELEEALIEDEIEVPDEKIYDASEGVKTDLEDVEHELTGAMDVVDAAFTGFLGDVKFNWGKFNPVLSFSYKLPFHDYTMELTYDFSESELRVPCRTASTGIWGIVLFVQSFLAISGAIRGVTEN